MAIVANVRSWVEIFLIQRTGFKGSEWSWVLSIAPGDPWTTPARSVEVLRNDVCASSDRCAIACLTEANRSNWVCSARITASRGEPVMCVAMRFADLVGLTGSP